MPKPPRSLAAADKLSHQDELGRLEPKAAGPLFRFALREADQLSTLATKEKELDDQRAVLLSRVIASDQFKAAEAAKEKLKLAKKKALDVPEVKLAKATVDELSAIVKALPAMVESKRITKEIKELTEAQRARRSELVDALFKRKPRVIEALPLPFPQLVSSNAPPVLPGPGPGSLAASVAAVGVPAAAIAAPPTTAAQTPPPKPAVPFGAGLDLPPLDVVEDRTDAELAADGDSSTLSAEQRAQNRITGPTKAKLLDGFAPLYTGPLLPPAKSHPVGICPKCRRNCDRKLDAPTNVWSWVCPECGALTPCYPKAPDAPKPKRPPPPARTTPAPRVDAASDLKS